MTEGHDKDSGRCKDSGTYKESGAQKLSDAQKKGYINTQTLDAQSLRHRYP